MVTEYTCGRCYRFLGNLKRCARASAELGTFTAEVSLDQVGLLGAVWGSIRGLVLDFLQSRRSLAIILNKAQKRVRGCPSDDLFMLVKEGEISVPGPDLEERQLCDVVLYGRGRRKWALQSYSKQVISNRAKL